MRFAIALCLAFVASAAAADTVVYSQTVNVYVPAQAAAEQMARRGLFGHCRNAGGYYEGIGFSTVSETDAIHRCCFWGKRRVREIGTAWCPAKRGWVAVVRYY
jgi:hypothetical protein